MICWSSLTHKYNSSAWHGLTSIVYFSQSRNVYVSWFLWHMRSLSSNLISYMYSIMVYVYILTTVGCPSFFTFPHLLLLIFQHYLLHLLFISHSPLSCLFIVQCGLAFSFCNIYRSFFIGCAEKIPLLERTTFYKKQQHQPLFGFVANH